jgi:hypothetical protein
VLDTDRVRLDEKSSAGLAVASWRGQLQLAWTGSDMRLNLASSPDGREIAVKQRLDQRSYKQETTSTGDTSSTRHVGLAPALATSGDRLYLAWRGSDHRVNIVTGAEEPHGPPVRLDEARTAHAPALCSHQGGLIVAWSGTDRRLNLTRLS